MRFSLYTLVDITETGARRGEDPKLMRQQQNFLTVLQTIGLRVNPTYIKAPVVKDTLPKHIEFGKKYLNVSKFWYYTFEIEYEDALNIETLKNDFHMVPVITGLDEEILLNISVFDTQNPDKINIIFESEDK